MKELDRLAYRILSEGILINTYESVNSENKPVSAVEMEYGKDILMMFFNSRNICTAIIKKG